MRRHQAWLLVVPIIVLAQPLPAQSSGATSRFGQGIARVSDNGTAVHLDLTSAGQGVLLRVSQNEPMRILQAGVFPSGQSVVRIPAHYAAAASPSAYASSTDPARAEQIAREYQRNCVGASTGDRLIDAMRKTECFGEGVTPVGQGTRTTSAPPLRAPAREYLLLVLSDQPLDTADVMARIAALTPGQAGVAPRDVAEYLVGARSPVWAGYRVRL